MTLTRTETASSAGATASASTGQSALSHLVSVPASGDHKAIGRMWIGASLLFGLLSLAAGSISAIERALGAGSIDLDGLIQGFESYGQYWTLHRISLVFLVVVPLFLGIATHVVPLQLGASSVAFPRAASAAFWVWLVSAVIMVVSWFIDGGFVVGGSVDAVNLSLASFAFVLLAIALGALVIATTVITQRVEGLWLERTPLFSWSMLIASTMWLLTIPVLLANVVLVWIDHQGSAVGALAQGDQIYDQFAWALDHPQIFAWLIPLLGIVGEIVPTAFGDRPRLHSVSQGAIALFGLLSFGAWAQPFFAAGSSTSPVYVLSALALALPVLVLAGGWGDLARRAGGARPGVHVILGLLSLGGLLAAGAVAGVRVLHPLINPISDVEGLRLYGTSATGGLLTLATSAGLAGAVAALYFWAPKIYGRKLNGGLVSLAALSIVGGATLSGITDVISGFNGQADDAVAMARSGANVSGATETLNWLSAIGTIGIAAGVGAALLAVLTSLAPISDDYWEDEDAANPWGGSTLEWATLSPPPLGNFSGPPEVKSPYPLLDGSDA